MNEQDTTTTKSRYTDTRLEAVIVCLNYGDFLNETLPYNLPHVDKIVVVTDFNDKVTKEVCRKWSVDCIPTDVFTEGGRDFEKGAAINMGLGALRQTGWVMQLDADIVLPLTFRNMLDKSALKRDCIYGCERCNVVGYSKWERIKRDWHNEPQFGGRYLVSTPEDCPIGANVVHKQWGYTPIGFLQLFHSEYLRNNELRYPETEGSAENMDVQFAMRWPRKNRILLPTVRVFHLESETSPMGTNWHGRKSKHFTTSGEALPVKNANTYGYLDW